MPPNQTDPHPQAAIKEPPRTLWGVLSHVGPSMILSASVVGSGELIMTTTLGAQAGFVALWVIVVSCLAKVCVQLEFGKHAISTGESTIEALSGLAGPALGRLRWSVWMWLVAQLAIFFQYGGIVKGVGQAMQIAVPRSPVWFWVLAAGLTTAVLLSVGRYRLIQNVSIVLMAVFTLLTLVCVVLLQTTPYRLSWADLAGGFRFRLPRAAVASAVAAFGLTGVGASEIIAYPYWCLERGYASFTGPRQSSDRWARRARGWIRVMYWDALLSMVVYTVVTAAFYVLGAAVLHGRGEIPARAEMIRTLSKLYTESAGPRVMALFLVGAIVVLYSTLFAGSAAWTRTFADAFSHAGLLDYRDRGQRRRWIAVLAWVFPLTWTVLGLAFRTPVTMVVVGGLANAALLVLVVFAAYVFRYRRLPPELAPSWPYDACLWISFVSIGAVGVLTLATLF